MRRPRRAALNAADAPPPDGGGRRAVAYWLGAGALYAGLGAWQPSWFLLGFQESLLYVLAATLLARRVLRRKP